MHRDIWSVFFTTYASGQVPFPIGRVAITTRNKKTTENIKNKTVKNRVLYFSRAIHALVSRGRLRSLCAPLVPVHDAGGEASDVTPDVRARRGGCVRSAPRRAHPSDQLTHLAG